MYEIIQGDCRTVLATLPDGSVHAIVTSPPYYGMRDYGVDGQIGLEQTPDFYIAEMVAVFREARRVLRDDGTFWLNIGDSYAGAGKDGGTKSLETNRRVARMFKAPKIDHGAKPKDLLMIPSRVALALQADGWYLRSEIIWAKPNPMPESVRDRPTSAHEKVYLFAKSGKPTIWQARDTLEWSNAPDLSETLLDDFDQPMPRWRWQSYFYDAEAVKEPAEGNPSGRNLRNVWTITPKPFKDAHFAVMPVELAERCIKAGCPKGGTVLDPFGGAGTTGAAAAGLGRDSILIELNQNYINLMRTRLDGIHV